MVVDRAISAGQSPRHRRATTGLPPARHNLRAGRLQRPTACDGAFPAARSGHPRPLRARAGLRPDRRPVAGDQRVHACSLVSAQRQRLHLPATILTGRTGRAAEAWPADTSASGAVSPQWPDVYRRAAHGLPVVRRDSPCSPVTFRAVRRAAPERWQGRCPRGHARHPEPRRPWAHLPAGGGKWRARGRVQPDAPLRYERWTALGRARPPGRQPCPGSGRDTRLGGETSRENGTTGA